MTTVLYTARWQGCCWAADWLITWCDGGGGEEGGVSLILTRRVDTNWDGCVCSFRGSLTIGKIWLSELGSGQWAPLSSSALMRHRHCRKVEKIDMFSRILK